MGVIRKLSNSANRVGAERSRGTRIGAVPPADNAEDVLDALQEMKADQRNEPLAARIAELEGLLAVSLTRYADVPMGEPRREPRASDLPVELWERPAPDPADFAPEHHLIGDLIGGLAPGAAERRAEAEARAHAAHAAALAEWQIVAGRRERALARLRDAARAHNREIAALETALEAGEPAAVELHARRVLEASPYPEGFPKAVTAALEAETGKLAVTLTAPPRDEAAPKAGSYRFVPERDHVMAIRRSEAAREELYQRVLAQMALRTLHEVFSTDRARRIHKMRVCLFADVLDPATGKPVRPRVLTVRATRRAIEALDLTRVDPVACVRRLKGAETAVGV